MDDSGNLAVRAAELFKKRLEYCDAVMIGRAAMTNPYIFKQIKDYMKTGKYDVRDYKDQIKDYLKLAEKHKIGFTQIKENTLRLTKGVVGGARIREEMTQCKNISSLRKLIP